MTCYPALLIVSKDGYKDADAVPGPHVVHEALDEKIVGQSTWLHKRYILDVRQESREIQHEAPPKPPYDAIATVIVLGQIATDMRTVNDCQTDPIGELLTGLYDEFNRIEIWIGTAQIGG